MINTNEIRSSTSLCIICLEELDEDIMEACDTCKINCHIQCLYSWYIKNKVELCPICLKHTDNNNNIPNELFGNEVFGNIGEVNDNIEEELNNINNDEINNNRENNNREVIEINVNNIREIFDNERIREREIKMSGILVIYIFILLTIGIMFITS